MIKSVNKLKTNTVKAFMQVFFGALNNNQTNIFSHLEPTIFPGEFKYSAHHYLLVESEKEDVLQITGAGKAVVYLMDSTKDILCIQKHHASGIYFAFKLVPTRTVTAEWLAALAQLVTYAAHTHTFKNLHEVLISYCHTGFKILPITPEVANTTYCHHLNRAKAIIG